MPFGTQATVATDGLDGPRDPGVRAGVGSHPGGPEEVSAFALPRPVCQGHSRVRPIVVVSASAGAPAPAPGTIPHRSGPAWGVPPALAVAHPSSRSPRAIATETGGDRDDEHRLWYVALTRTRYAALIVVPDPDGNTSPVTRAIIDSADPRLTAASDPLGAWLESVPCLSCSPGGAGSGRLRGAPDLGAREALVRRRGRRARRRASKGRRPTTTHRCASSC